MILNTAEVTLPVSLRLHVTTIRAINIQCILWKNRPAGVVVIFIHSRWLTAILNATIRFFDSDKFGLKVKQMDMDVFFKETEGCCCV